MVKLTTHMYSHRGLTILSYDVASGCDISPCNKVDKPLVVYRFTRNVMTSIKTLRTWWQKYNVFTPEMRFQSICHMIDRILHSCFCIIEFIKLGGEKEIKCSASLAFYLFSSTRLKNSLKREHSCKILYILLMWTWYATWCRFILMLKITLTLEI